MVNVVFRPRLPGDIEELLANMRKADRDEVEAASGNVETTLHDSVRLSEVINVMEVDGKLACMFGLAPLPELSPYSAAPWMLGTDIIDRHPSALMRHSPGYLDAMHTLYPHLANYVDARNKRSIRWLRWLGFVIYEPEPYGVGQLPFHPFERSV